MWQTRTICGPTRDARRLARQRMEWLETAFHAGPDIGPDHLHEFKEFLQGQGFPPNSQYFERLARLENLLRLRTAPPQAVKRDYAGYAAGCWMQLQSIYDHCILSVCYDGEFRRQPGRIKISHRFNRAGRVDFVEAKLLQSLDPKLHGALRKLITIRDYAQRQPDWWCAPAYTLRVLPRELLFLHPEIFRCARSQLLAWLINIGHRTVADLVDELTRAQVPGSPDRSRQWPLSWLPRDPVAWPILQQAAHLEAFLEPGDSPDVSQVRYLRRLPVPAQAGQVAAATC